MCQRNQIASTLLDREQKKTPAKDQSYVSTRSTERLLKLIAIERPEVFLTIASKTSICQHQPSLWPCLRVRACTHASRGERGRFLSRSASAPKIPTRFGEFLVRGRLGPEIRVWEQTNKNKRALDYLFSTFAMNPHRVLLFFSCRGRCIHIYTHPIVKLLKCDKYAKHPRCRGSAVRGKIFSPRLRISAIFVFRTIKSDENRHLFHKQILLFCIY